LRGLVRTPNESLKSASETSIGDNENREEWKKKNGDQPSVHHVFLNREFRQKRQWETFKVGSKSLKR